MKTLDELAAEVLALNIKIAKADKIIVDAGEIRYQHWLSKSKIIDEAFLRIASRDERVAWVKKAKTSLYAAITCRKMSRAKDSRIWLITHFARHAIYQRNNRNQRKKQFIEANTFPGAFAIMMQSLEQQTPKEFMAFLSVHEADVISLIEFLKEALGANEGKAHEDI